MATTLYQQKINRLLLGWSRRGRGTWLRESPFGGMGAGVNMLSPRKFGSPRVGARRSRRESVLMAAATMMSVAVWLAYNKSKNSNKILVIYFVHLFINASWSYVFFYYKQIFLASFVISIIIFFILYLMVLYSKYSKPSVVLMLPYFAWSTYALYLNSTIYILNSSY